MTLLVSKHDEALPLGKGRGQKVAMPVVFDATIGLFMPALSGVAGAGIAVLLASPWGYEDMCTRKSWRILAEKLSDNGIASLRFDYRGTGDALDFADDTAGLDVWRSDLEAAADKLRDLSGVRDIIVIGQGIGASLAHDVFTDAEDVRGIALLAPVLSGRAYVREMSIWAQMIEEVPAEKGGALVFGGVSLPRPLVADIRALNLSEPGQGRVGNYLIASRFDPPTETTLADRLRSQGAVVDLLPYEGYDALVHDVSTSKPPTAMFETVIDWIKRIDSRPAISAFYNAVAATLPAPVSARLQGEEFVETPVRFGEEGRLYGILCEPAGGQRRGATVVMLSTAYERAAGWGRSSVLAARHFAAEGIASLRFDPANVADSPPLPGVPEQIIYSEAQHRDVDEAIGFLESRDLAPVVLTGRCSGGYMSFRRTARDSRVRGAVVINAYTLFWDPSQSIDEWLQFSPQRLTSYGVKALRLETWKRIFAGEVNLKYAALNTFRFIRKRILEFAGPVAAALPGLSREKREVHGAFQSIQKHNAELVLMYRDNDVGLHHLTYHFGPEGRKLGRYPNARLVLVPDADRNMTKPHARAVSLKTIADMAQKFPPSS